MTAPRHLEIDRVRRALKRARLAREAHRVAPTDAKRADAYLHEALQLGGMHDDLGAVLRMAERAARHERCVAFTRATRAAKKADRAGAAAGGEAAC